MAKPSVADRVAIEDLYADYAWALDTGDLGAFFALFTDDCVFGDTAGNRYKGHAETRKYVEGLVKSAPFKGRMHLLTAMRFDQQGERIGVKAYWHVAKWEKAANVKKLETMGWSDDAFVKVNGQWKFAQRLVHHWNDTDLPWAGPR